MPDVDPDLTLTPSPQQNWIRYVAWASLILFAALQAVGSRHAMNPDGISYLDLAEAVARGNFAETINAYWSPLYPWLLGLALSVIQPNAFWEFSVAHLVNFVIFLGALAAFEFFLTQLLAGRARAASVEGDEARIPLWVWRLLAYAAFGWAALTLNGLARVTPDLIVVMVVFVAAGILLKLAFASAGLTWFAGLGAALAVGYLAKGAMLPLSIPLLIAAWITGHPRRRLGLAVACAVFVVLAAPFVLTLSLKQGRPTVGDTGRLNYAWWVNNVPLYKHWHGEPEGTGAPQHPTIALDAPATYSFARPVSGTYPLWYDPSYWHDGLIVRFDPVNQMKQVASEIRHIPWVMADLFLTLTAFVLLYWRKQIDIRGRNLLLFGLPLGATMGMYVLVHFEPRFVAGFLGVFVASLLLYVRPRSRAGREATLVFATALAVLLATRVLELAAGSVQEISRQGSLGPEAHAEWVTASELRRTGLQQGANISFIGDSFRAYWAHLANYRISSEVVAQQFRNADAAGRAAALNTLRATGATAILADTAIACSPEEGWSMIPKTGLCTYQPLNPPAALQPRK